MITRFQLPKHGQETHGWNKLEEKKQKFEKPTIKNIQELVEEPISDEVAHLLLEQIEELCLIMMEEYTNG